MLFDDMLCEGDFMETAKDLHRQEYIEAHDNFSIVATDAIVHFKKALRSVHFEAALTFNRHC